VRRGGTAHRAALSAAGLALGLAVLSPYVVMVLTALKPAGELRVTPPRLTPLQWRPETFLEVLADGSFQGWLRASLAVALASTVIAVLAATPAAYYTARHRFPGRSAFLLLVLVTQMFSPTALVVGLYRQFFELDLVDTYAALDPRGILHGDPPGDRGGRRRRRVREGGSAGPGRAPALAPRDRDRGHLRFHRRLE
jgi:multiple sugar transport system permease protein